MEKKENPGSLVVGMQICAATVENSMKLPEKIKNRSAICNFTSGYFSEENKNINLKNIYITPFIAVLFTIAKIWKQPKCLSIDD